MIEFVPILQFLHKNASCSTGSSRVTEQMIKSGALAKFCNYVYTLFTSKSRIFEESAINTIDPCCTCIETHHNSETSQQEFIYTYPQCILKRFVDPAISSLRVSHSHLVSRLRRAWVLFNEYEPTFTTAARRRNINSRVD